MQAARSTLSALLPRASFCFGNTDELEAFGELSGWSGDTTSLAASLATSLAPGGIAAITAGAEPVLLATASGVTTHTPVALAAGELRDSNGCGDGFAGGFLAAAAMELDTCECMRIALACAAAIAKCTGVPRQLTAMQALTDLNPARASS